jgi:quercetin dioxygenase-like cupin family protein
MSSWEDDLVDPFLAEVPDGAEAFEDLARATGEDAAAPSASLRAALLQSARLDGRFERYVPSVARMLDLPLDGARALLDRLGRNDIWEQGPAPDVSLFHVQGGPKVAGHVTGFVRMPQGSVFPEHQHLGAEEVLVIQGSYVDGVTNKVYRPGDIITMPAESSHDFRARAGPALVYLVVLAEGVVIGDEILTADDPRL